MSVSNLWKNIKSYIVLSAVTLVLLAVAPVRAQEAGSSPSPEPTGSPVSVLASLTTDKLDYYPWETVTVSGSGLLPIHNYSLTIYSNDPPAVSYTTLVTTSVDGSFSAHYTLDGNYRPDYAMTLHDGDVIVASGTFTDAFTAGVDMYSQCMNDDGDGYATGDIGCRWTNGAINPSNSVYHEDDATVQRLAIKDLTNGDHTVLIKYGTTKGGKHAYDFLTDDNFSELSPNPLTSADLCDPSISNLADCATLAPVASSLIPTDSNAVGHDVARSARHFNIRNGSWVGSGFVSGPTLVSGTYAGDSDTALNLKFHVDTSTCHNKYQKQGTDVCEVLITWGAHVSTQADWGAGSSAVNINGSPYHVQIADVEGTATQGGGLDNQMQANSIVLPNTLTIHKVTSPTGGSGFGFTTTGGLSPSTFSLNDAGTQSFTPAPGTYTVSENNPAPAYALTGLTCGTVSGTGTSATPNVGTRTVSVTFPAAGGGNVDCTYTNTLQQGTLRVIKHVINDNGGSAVAANFTLHVKSSGTDVSSSPAVGSETGTDYTLNQGTYVVSENTPVTGYSMTGFSGDCDSNGSVTVVPGTTKTCTITNDDIQPKLTLTKIVVNNNGGSAVVSDFPLFVNATGVTSGVQNVFNAGSYTASETNKAGYTAGSWTGDCAANGSVTLAAGDVKACTITNDDQQAYITVIKAVNNTHGGNANPDDFDLTLEGNAVSSGVQVPVNPGTYTAGETLISGYAFDGFSGDCDSNGDVTVALGENKTCTLTNSDQQAYITVVKVVNNNHGGTAAPNDFNLTLEGNAVSSGVAVPVNPGTYTAGETLLTGYTSNGFSGDCNSSGATTVALGESKTCTLTNSDIQPKLTLVKTVVNNNGGTLGVSDFPLFVNSTGVTSGTKNGFNAGSYTASETQQTGYLAGDWGGDCAADGSISLAIGDDKTCTITNDDVQPELKLIKIVDNKYGGQATTSDFQGSVSGTNVDWNSFVGFDAGSYDANETSLYGYSASDWSGDCAKDGAITLAVGDSKTCTITNSDIQPKLTVIKVVENNYGGTLHDTDFPLFVGGTGVTTGVVKGMNAGTYSVTETQQTGYAFDEFTGDCDENGSVTLAVGDDKTCTLTNHDIQPKLTLIKHVMNDNGGKKVVSDFPLFVNTGSVLSGETNGFNAGNYTASETADPGYAASAWSNACAADGSVSLVVGDDKTCEITNDDISPTLTVNKVVVPSTDTGLFNLQIDSETAGTGTDVGDGGTTGSVDVDAGSHTVGEIAGTDTSIDDYISEISGDCAADGTITLALAENKTCTITNTRKAKLTIVKDADPNDTQDFNFNGGQVLGSFNLDNDEGVVDSLDQGLLSDHKDFSGLTPDQDYTVTEGAEPAFWEFKGATCKVTGTDTAFGSSLTGQALTVHLNPGDDVTCTFVNHNQRPTRTLGFWQTHTSFTTDMFNTKGPFYIGSNVVVGSGTHKGILTTPGQVFGAFFAPIPKTTTGSKRSAVDQARVTLLQQLMAAKLNCQTFGCDNTVKTMIAAADTAYAGGNQGTIQSFVSQLDAYNNSGDTIIIGNAGSATPTQSKSIATLSFWDQP